MIDIYGYMETKLNHEGNPIVNVCAYCQQINASNMVQFASGVEQKVKDEMKIVDSQIRANTDKFSFSHGICIPHAIQMYSDAGYSKDELEKMASEMKHKNTSVPCLLENEPIRRAYMNGIFTVEQMKQTQQPEEQNKRLTERFKTLAGIKS